MFRALMFLCLMLTACAPMARPSSRAQPATAGVPDDFWLGVTVLGPVRENLSAYEAVPRAVRPGRYVVEADRVLRVALGPGAKDDAFPPPTRRLSAAEFSELYGLVKGAGLLSAEHPDRVATPPAAPDRGEGDARTLYVIGVHARGKRQMVSMEALPKWDEGVVKVARVVDWLAGKAWVERKDFENSKAEKQQSSKQEQEPTGRFAALLICWFADFALRR